MPWTTETEETGATVRGVRVEFEEEKEEEEMIKMTFRMDESSAKRRSSHILMFSFTYVY